MKNQDMIEEILVSIEYLDTTEGDSVPCVSVEELFGILSEHKIITKQQEVEANGRY